MTHPQINLTTPELEIVTNILSRFVPRRQVRAFGSRVKGKSKRFSDLDLVVMGEEPLPSATMADLREAFVESDLPYKVDLIEWAGVSEIFQTVIESKSVVIL